MRDPKERLRDILDAIAALSVNRELVLLYWQIGREILQRQQQEGWGAKVIDRLARDLRREFPEMKGLSRSNLSMCGPSPRPTPTSNCPTACWTNSELGTIYWPNGADLDPDVLYTRITGKPIPILAQRAGSK